MAFFQHTRSLSFAATYDVTVCIDYISTYVNKLVSNDLISLVSAIRYCSTVSHAKYRNTLYYMTRSLYLFLLAPPFFRTLR